MSLIALDEAKTYLRVDSGMEDDLIGSLLLTAEKLTEDVARLSASEWEKLCDETTEEMTIRDRDLLVGEILQLRSLIRQAVLYSLGYMDQRKEEKVERVICPGTINTQKDVAGLVEAFKQINYPLLIIGQFVSMTLYDELLKSKSDNTTIENRRLDYNEYCQLIAESAYCITP